jgi:alpha-L-arabinofuranosidase
VTGTWAVADGRYVQSSGATDARSTAGRADWSGYTLDVDATKTGGAEGFLVMFGVKDTGNYYWWNLGGWGNTTSAVEKAVAGGKSTIATSPDTIETGRTYHLRIALQGRTIRLYLDGRLVNEFTDDLGRIDPLYQVVSRDSRTGDTIVKVVNARDTALRTDVVVSGPRLGGNATVSSLTGSPGAVNSLAEPDVIAPVTSRADGLGNRFRYDFPAHSVTVLRLSPPLQGVLRAHQAARVDHLEVAAAQ